MDQNFIFEILTGKSDELDELRGNISVLEGFIDFAQELDALPEINKRFYEESRSLYQATCANRPIEELESLLSKYFGPPVKPSGKPLPRKFRKNSSVRYLGGVEKEQSLFLLPLKTGEFYGALWPWRRNKAKIEIHLGYCSDWMVDEDYQQLEVLVKRSLSHNAFEQMDTDSGGQIHGIGLSSFLQMAEMEQSTFTLSITSANQTGQLYVKEGQLIAAETDEFAGRDAAYRIIAWDNVNITIQAADPDKSDEIQQPLMHVLMESLKIKDEITSSFEMAPPLPPPKKPRRKASDSKPAKRLVRLERAPTPKAQRSSINLTPILAAILGVVVVLSCCFVAGLYILNLRGETRQFNRFMSQVEQTESVKQKIDMLENYLEVNPKSHEASKIKAQIENYTEIVEDRDFESAVLKVSSLPLDETYEKKAVAIYGDFLEKYPTQRNQQRINAAIGGIKKLLDQYYYEELKRAARLDLSERLKVYRDYLARFPEGRYQKDVEVLINEMGRQYLDYLKSEDEKCEQTKRWKPCMQRYEKFISDFEGSELAQQARKTITALKDRSDLIKLRQAREEADTNYAKAYDAYQDYLSSHPDSTERKTIEDELDALKKKMGTQMVWKSVRDFASNPNNDLFERIQRLDRYIQTNGPSPYISQAQEIMRQLEAQRLISLRENKRKAQKQAELARIQREEEQQALKQRQLQQLRATLTEQLIDTSRFRPNGDDTFSDQTTGMTWAMIDSYQMLDGCINYDDAKTYVQNLRIGGFSDWRLPTAAELAPLYKKTPFFPQSGADWYWTSEAAVKGFYTVVTTVTSRPETVFTRESRKTTECGSVRAVRP